LKKLCIATAYDSQYGKLGNYTAASIQSYADAFGYDARVISTAEIEGRSTAWYRIQLIQELFDEGFDWVLWIDADAIFLRHNIDILGQTEEGKDLYFVPEIGPLKYPYPPAPNTGVMLLRNSAWTRGLLAELMDRGYYRHQFPWEQGALWELLGHFEALSRFDDTVKGPDQVDEERYKKIKVLPKEWNAMFLFEDFRVENPIILHFAGQDPEKRHQAMMNHYLGSKEQDTDLVVKLQKLETEKKDLQRQLNRMTESPGYKIAMRVRRWFVPVVEKWK